VLNRNARSLSLIPFSGWSRSELRERIYNVLAFVPLGLLLGAIDKRPGLARKIAPVLGLSLAIETVQFVFAIGAADITDVMTNTLGGVAGLALYNGSSQLFGQDRSDRSILLAGAALLALLVLLLGVLLSHHVRYQSTR
jgi:glycopeptide antibiotics resistance protein